MSQAIVVCAGLNHNTAPVEEREKLAFTQEELPDALQNAAARLGSGAVILSTCNRTELYSTFDEGEEHDLVALLNALKGAAVDAEHFYVLRHRAAVEHLYRVAAGIDSMVLGEPQILGQVREAFSAATAAGTLNGILSRLFHTAMSVGKRARAETDIGRHAVSVGSAAVLLARKALGDLTGRAVLVISAGSMGKLAARALARQTGSGRILLANRTLGRAESLAEALGGATEAYGFDRIQEALAIADIVISGTSAREYVVSPADVQAVMPERAGREIMFIDIAVPRDIHPRVGGLPGVHLYDIDDIEAVTEEGWDVRQGEIARVESIIGQQYAAFEEWWKALDVVPVISSLMERAESIRAAELERTLRQLPALDDEARQRIDLMTEAIVAKLLDRPISRLKNGSDRGRLMEAVEDLFGVQSGHPRRARPG